jgi:hypothetical protein
MRLPWRFERWSARLTWEAVGLALRGAGIADHFCSGKLSRLPAAQSGEHRGERRSSGYAALCSSCIIRATISAELWSWI